MKSSGMGGATALLGSALALVLSLGAAPPAAEPDGPGPGRSPVALPIAALARLPVPRGSRLLAGGSVLRFVLDDGRRWSVSAPALHGTVEFDSAGAATGLSLDLDLRAAAADAGAPPGFRELLGRRRESIVEVRAERSASWTSAVPGVSRTDFSGSLAVGGVVQRVRLRLWLVHVLPGRIRVLGSGRIVLARFAVPGVRSRWPFGDAPEVTVTWDLVLSR